MCRDVRLALADVSREIAERLDANALPNLEDLTSAACEQLHEPCMDLVELEGPPERLKTIEQALARAQGWSAIGGGRFAGSLSPFDSAHKYNQLMHQTLAVFGFFQNLNAYLLGPDQ